MLSRVSHEQTDIAFAVEQRDRGWEALDHFCLERDRSAVLWVVAPLLRAFYLQLQPAPVAGPFPQTRTALERLGNHAYSTLRPSNAVYLSAGPALFTSSTEAHRWPMEAIIEEARSTGTSVGEVRARASPNELRKRNREALALAHEFIEHIVLEGVQAPCPPAWVYRQFLGAARYLAHARALLSRWDGNTVVIGSNHDKATRALAWMAHQTGRASVYVPHAPMIRDPRFWDLPVHYAALRGKGEVEAYLGMGVDPDALAVVGDPGLVVPSECRLDPGDRIAFALPLMNSAVPFRMWSLRSNRAIEVGRSSNGSALEQTIHAISTVNAAADDVVVTPHPGHSLSEVRALCPDRWRVYSGRTFEFLRDQGPTALIQHSSGVALEALLLGIPTIQLSLEGWSPNYMAIDPEHVPFVESSDELADALAESRAIAVDSGRRDDLIRWARRWCEVDGPAAAKRGWSLVERAATDGPRPTLAWDAWEPAELAQLS